MDTSSAKIINIDWKKRFKNMYIDTTSTFKNIIRFDGKDAIKKKDEFNKNVDKMIEHINITQSHYNSLVTGLKESNQDYQTHLALARKAAEEAERNPNSLQSKILNCRRKLNDLKKDFQNTTTSSVTKEIKPEYNSNTPTKPTFTGQLDHAVTSYNNNIRNCRKNFFDYNSKKNSRNEKLATIEEEISNLKEKIYDLTAQKNNLENSKKRFTPKNQKEYNSLSIEISDYLRQQIQKEDEKSKLQKEVAEYDKHILFWRKKLKEIDDNMHSYNESLIQQTFIDIKQRTDKISSEINSKIAYLNTYLKIHVKSEAGDNSNIATSKTIHNLNEKLKILYSNFCGLGSDDFNKIYNKKAYDSGLFKGFFTFLSTKQKTLKEINNAIDKINSVLDKTSKEVSALKNKIKLFSNPNYSNAGNISSIANNIRKVEDIQKEIDKLKENFKSMFTETSMPIILMPVYQNNFILSVAEGTIVKK